MKLYKCDAESYRKTLRSEIAKEYQGVEVTEVQKVNKEAAEKLKLKK